VTIKVYQYYVKNRMITIMQRENNESIQESLQFRTLNIHPGVPVERMPVVAAVERMPAVVAAVERIHCLAERGQRVGHSGVAGGKRGPYCALEPRNFDCHRVAERAKLVGYPRALVLAEPSWGKKA
jgi:hypothetical protein